MPKPLFKNNLIEILNINIELLKKINKEISINFNSFNNKEIIFNCDNEQMNRAIFNLIKNSI